LKQTEVTTNMSYISYTFRSVHILNCILNHAHVYPA